MKKISLACLIITLCTSQALALENLKTPQGRVGIGNNTEEFVINKTNLTINELENINTIIKQFNKTKDNNIKTNKKQEITNTQKEVTNTQTSTIEQTQTSDNRNIKINNEFAQKLVEAHKKNPPQNENNNISNNDKDNNLWAKFIKVKSNKTNKKEDIAEDSVSSQNNKISKKTFFSDNKTLKEEKTQNIDNPIEENKKTSFKFFNKSNKSKTETQPKEETLDKTEETKVTTENTTPTIKVNPNQDIETRIIVKEISEEIVAAKPEMLEDLSILWVSAVQKSDTVYFAIMKLSNPNGEEVNKKGVKKILEPIISVAPLVGQAFVNPALTAGSLIGSNVMGSMLNDGPTQRLTKINDADLVILARAIDELQKTLLVNYMAYKGTLAEYKMAIKIAEDRKKEYESLNKTNSPNIVLANTFYVEALDNQYKARQEFLMKRVVLEQMVGSDALLEIEQKDDILKHENTKEANSQQTDTKQVNK